MKIPSDCQVMRRKYVVTRVLEDSKIIKSEWVDEKCGTPLFSPKSKYVGVCDSCLKGWTHKENFMLDTEENKKLITKAKTL